MRRNRLTAMFVIVSMLFGCTSYAPIAIRTSGNGDVQLSEAIVPGDRVRVVGKSGETSEFRAVVVEQDRVSSETATYRYEDLQSIEVRRAQDERTTLIVVIGIVVIAAGFALLNEVEDGIECTLGGC